jgi:hypothetical protein
MDASAGHDGNRPKPAEGDVSTRGPVRDVRARDADRRARSERKPIFLGPVRPEPVEEEHAAALVEAMVRKIVTPEAHANRDVLPLLGHRRYGKQDRDQRS